MIKDLIQRPRHAKTPAVAPAAGGEPAARARPEVIGEVVPGAAANHTTAAIPFPAVRCPLPQVPNHVRQARRVRAVRTDGARSIRPCPQPQPVTPGPRPGSRPLPFRLGRQPIRHARRTAQPRHICLRVVPAHARHRMAIRLRKTGVAPGIATERDTSPAPRRHPSPTRTPDTLPPSPRSGPSPGCPRATPPSPGTRRSPGTPPRVGAPHRRRPPCPRPEPPRRRHQCRQHPTPTTVVGSKASAAPPDVPALAH